MLQGSPEWHEWRRKGIGASDVAAILNKSPWSTPFKLWQEKTGRKESFEGNFATRRGNELESKARSRYEFEVLEDMPPGEAVHPKFTICRASLDGIRADGKVILELKCPGEKDHALAMSGIVPEYYLIQIQYQLAVTGADVCHYYSFGPDESSIMIEVCPDLEMQGMLVNAALEFWEKYVLADVAPPLTEDDVKEVDGPEFETLFMLVERGDDRWKSEIIKIGGHNKIRYGKYLLSKLITKTGKISYRLTTKKDQATETKEVG